MELDFGVNQGFVEEQYLRYCGNPAAVDPSWRRFFETLARENAAGLSALAESANGSSGTSEQTAGATYHEQVKASSSPAETPVANGNGHGNGSAQGAVHARNGNGTNGNGAYARAALGPGVTGALPATAEYVPRASGAQPSRPSAQLSADALLVSELQGRVSALVNAYRVRGHVYANLDPLSRNPPVPTELSLAAFGLDEVDPSTLFFTGDMAGATTLPLSEIVGRLKETYCRTIGVEFTFMEDPEERFWLQRRMESTLNRTELSNEEQLVLLTKLIDAELFEQFLHTKYVGAKRFSLEGAESVIPLMELLIQSSAKHKVEEIVIGMAHRGRLNVLANVMEKSMRELFFAFNDDRPEMHVGRGDVKYHMGFSSDRYVEGTKVHLTLCFNPSHLEWVNPVVEGRARAKSDRKGDLTRGSVLPLVIHGDAAFAGQGVVAETLNFSRLQGYTTGGTVHLVINNQIGFTTAQEDSRSSPYCTDITRMLRCPVFHVNGEDPEAVAQVVRLACDFRQQFAQDVVIDMYCYRRYGHNEADEPRYTQPVMYSLIDKQPSVREMYVRRLQERGFINANQAQEIAKRRQEEMETELLEARRGSYVPPEYSMAGVWRGYKGGPDIECPEADTAVPIDRLKTLATKITSYPEDFEANPKVKRFLKDRYERATGEKVLDWGTAETLAYGSLLEEGTRVRLSGQDSRRGTFSHRHAVLFDARTGRRYMPLMHVTPELSKIEVWDSPLSEAGVLGFEYGYSLDSPDALVIWEAQFGDFANTAQVTIDQFISSSEDKWHRLNGLVMLLPHGFEGQGPEHSSARLERFLALSAEDNMQVCNLTTPAQIFHALRRQVLRPYRKPLVIMSPKSLLRHPDASSTLEDLSTGAFQRIIPDKVIAPKAARRVILCSGKVYYDLLAARTVAKKNDIAIIRVEQLYPLQPRDVLEVLKPYKDGTDLVWVQEEPWNSGAWYFMNARLPGILQGRFPLRGVTRAESASPATGSHAAHKLEQERLIEEALR
ncbi:MAG: 2-oxoglutarate dehydrogenase component [Myxococcaceae bacterium]|nr:2-oxoglutarate dehydrogenase component [Myxococcaceae bacterium]